MKKLKNLPIATQDFENLIDNTYLYLDKTKDIAMLLTSKRVYFLSRPRRFGKSLLLTTLKQIFENKNIGAWIIDNIKNFIK